MKTGATDGGKKVKGRKRHLLVDTEGFVLRAKVHSAKVMNYEGIKTLLHRARERFPRLLRHLWLEAGYRAQRTRARTGCAKTCGLERRSHRASTEACPGRGSDGVG